MNGTNYNKKIVSNVKTSGKAKPLEVKKQKVLLPTLKEQQRYVIYVVLIDGSGKNLGDFSIVHNNIIQQCNAFLGVFDGGKAGLMGVKFNPEASKGVIRVNNKYVDKLKLCFGLITNINGIPVTVDCVSVSGMLNKAVDRMNG